MEAKYKELEPYIMSVQIIINQIQFECQFILQINFYLINNFDLEKEPFESGRLLGNLEAKRNLVKQFWLMNFIFYYLLAWDSNGKEEGQEWEDNFK